MKKYFFQFIKFIIINNLLYRAYLNIPKKIKFDGIQNFNPIPIKKKSVNSLVKIDDHYFSKKTISSISLEMHSFEWIGEFKNAGGLDLLKKSRLLILDWNNNKFKLN